MAFTTNPYCVLADVKDMLDLSSNDDDVWLTSLIPQAQSFLDREIGYSFQTDGSVPSPATRVYSGQNHDVLVIDDLIQLVQVLELTSNAYIGANGVWQSGTVQTYDITADCLLGPGNTIPAFTLQRTSSNPFYLGRQNYKVLGVFGQPAIPGEITRACARLVSHWVKMRDTNYTDTIAEQGFVRMRFVKQIPADIAEIISAYRKRNLLTSWGGV
jgi:hypothetical protein